MAVIRAQLERLLTSPRQELGRWARFLRFQIELWRYCARRLHANNVTAMSAALSFRTVFAMIPVLVLVVLMLKSVGALEDSKRSLRRFLEASGFRQIAVTQPVADSAGGRPVPASAPAVGVNLADQVEKLVTNVEHKLTFERIGPIGGVLLIWTALTLLTTIERALNRIFEAPRSRALGRRVLLYWSAMTLGPIVMVAASYLGGNVIDTFQGTAGLSWMFVVLGRAGPALVGIIVLAAVYKYLPNTQVPMRSAIGGAVVAVPVWLTAKWGFSLYVRHFVVTGNLYGLLGVLPLFLLWLNLSWLIFLFGAELAHTATNLGRMRLAERAERLLLGPSDMLAVLVAVAQSFAEGRGPAAFQEIAGRLNLPGEAVARLLDRLRAGGLVVPAGDEEQAAMTLGRPPEDIAVREVLQLADPHVGDGPAPAFEPPIDAALAPVRRGLANSVGALKLSDLLAAARSGSA